MSHCKFFLLFFFVDYTIFQASDPYDKFTLGAKSDPIIFHSWDDNEYGFTGDGFKGDNIDRFVFQKACKKFLTVLAYETPVDDAHCGLYQILSIFDPLDLGACIGVCKDSDVNLNNFKGVLAKKICDGDFFVSKYDNPLMYACFYHKDTRIIHCLLEHKADPNKIAPCSRYKGKSMQPLDIIFDSTYVENIENKVKLLMQYGAQPISKHGIDHKGENFTLVHLIHACLYYSKTTVMEILLQNGANPHERDVLGNNVLDYASDSRIENSSAKVELLMKYGARPATIDALRSLIANKFLHKIELSNLKSI